MSMGANGLEPRRIGKLVILRLTPRMLRRWRLGTVDSSRISCRTALWNLFWSRGGNSAEDGQFAADNAYGVEKGQPVRILIPAQRGFVHEATDCEMRHQQTVELLSYQVRRLAPQNDARSPQMSLEFVECGFDFPTFVIDRRQFGGRRQFVVEDRVAAGPFQRHRYGSDKSRPADVFHGATACSFGAATVTRLLLPPPASTSRTRKSRGPPDTTCLCRGWAIRSLRERSPWGHSPPSGRRKEHGCRSPPATRSGSADMRSCRDWPPDDRKLHRCPSRRRHPECCSQF